MEIIKNHYKRSDDVLAYADIREDVEELKKFIIEADKKRECYCIHHAQVSEDPWNFFVIHPRWVLGDDRLFEHQVIINPKIIDHVDIERASFEKLKIADTPANRKWWANFDLAGKWVSEGCMSFPFRQPKKVYRYYQINVEYYDNKFQLHKTRLVGTAAQIFQHEVLHGQGKNIYFLK
jgi:peptide deformylase